MKKFIFDLQRFALTFEFTNGTKTFEDRGNIGGDGEHYDIYQYYPTAEWNDYLQFQNYKTNRLTAINEYRCFPDAISNGWQDWQETVPGETFSGDYRILSGGNREYHALENHGASYVQMYGRNDGAVLNNDGGNNALMFGGTGNDYITNSGNFVEINAGAGGDYISNSAENHVTIDAGDDEIFNSGTNVKILAGNNNDRIENKGIKVTIDAGAGADSIYNAMESGETTIYGGADNDSILNGGYSVFIDGGTEDDIIENTAHEVTISGGDGSDSIVNNNGVSAIDGGDGNNTIRNGIFEGHDAVTTMHSGVTVGSFVVDKKIKGGSYVTIVAGKNNDKIYNYDGSNITIDAGAGNDQISLRADMNISLKTGNGSNSVYAFAGSNLTIDAGDEKNLISISSSWNHVTVNGGNDKAGMDFIFNESNNALINGNSGFNIVRNSGKCATIFGGDDCNQLLNYGDNSLIKGGNGIDYLYSNNAENIKIDGGGAADTIEVYHDVGASISGGEGNDNIFVGRVSAEDVQALKMDMTIDIINAVLGARGIPGVISADIKDWLLALAGTLANLKKLNFVGMGINIVSGIKTVVDNWSDGSLLNKLNYSESTVNGGTGNNTIVSDGFAPRVFQYKFGDGNDEIHNFATNKNSGKDATHLSTLHITAGDIEKVVVDNTDVIFTIGTGSVKLVNAANHKFKLREADGTLTTRAYGINYDTNEVVCSIFGSAANDDIQDNVDIKRDRTTYLGAVDNIKCKNQCS